MKVENGIFRHASSQKYTFLKKKASGGYVPSKQEHKLREKKRDNIRFSNQGIQNGKRWREHPG